MNIFALNRYNIAMHFSIIFSIALEYGHWPLEIKLRIVSCDVAVFKS